MTTFTIDEVVNGFVVRAYNPSDGYLINEFFEERLGALKSVELYLRDEIIAELERRTKYASSM